MSAMHAMNAYTVLRSMQSVNSEGSPNTTVGKAIRAARRKAKITQAELAKLVEVDPSTVSDWENNRHKPRPAEWEAVQQELGIDPQDPHNVRIPTPGPRKPIERRVHSRVNRVTMTDLIPSETPEEEPESLDERCQRIGGYVARAVANAVKDAIIQDDLTKTRKGQEAIGRALSRFAATLADEHFRDLGKLIEAAELARHAAEMIERGVV